MAATPVPLNSTVQERLLPLPVYEEGLKMLKKRYILLPGRLTVAAFYIPLQGMKMVPDADVPGPAA